MKHTVSVILSYFCQSLNKKNYFKRKGQYTLDRPRDPRGDSAQTNGRTYMKQMTAVTMALNSPFFTNCPTKEEFPAKTS